MSIVSQPRAAKFTNLRIAIWSAFLLVVVAPLLFERFGHPYFGAALLRPGGWILARVSTGIASQRAIVLLNFVIYLLVIYAGLRVLRRNRQNVRQT